VRLKQAAPVAGALVDGDHLGGRHGLEIVEAERGLTAGAFAADLELPGLGVDELVVGLGNVRQMIAHEEGVVRRDRGAEILDRRLVLAAGRRA
jgi:hypothetical protein